MANTFLLLVIIIVLIGVYLHYTDSSILQQFCPNCARSKVGGKCPVCPDCPSCDMRFPAAMEILDQLAKGCLYRIRGVQRESEVSKNNVQFFLDGGNKRVVIVTNMVPETFVRVVQSGDKSLLNQIKAAVIGSATVAGKKTYMVMSMTDGKMNPAGAPTTVFDDAFNYFENRAHADVGSDALFGKKRAKNNNLAVYIDEDIECVTPIANLENKTINIENCCGRRQEGLEVLNDSEAVGLKYGDSMYNYYASRI